MVLQQDQLNLLVMCVVVVAVGACQLSRPLSRVPKVLLSSGLGLLLGLALSTDRSVRLLRVADSTMPMYVSMYMPAVAYTVTIQMSYHVFCCCVATCCILGAAGLAISTLLSGTLMYFTRTSLADMKDALFAGSLLSFQEPTVITDIISPSP
ncbi:uncharacterized protein LOC135372650 isoform X2 [Ornithodoros turicata]